jgi:tetratricopeptide (TPR) repeat protein
MIAAGIGLCFCAAGIAFGQGGFIPHGGSSIYGQPTPAEQAALDKAYQLEADGHAALNSGKFALAESDARKAMASGRSGYGIGVALLASSLNAEGKKQEAIKTYSDIATAGSNDPHVLLPYALLLLKGGQWAKALEVYNKALPQVGSFLFDGHDLLVDNNDFSADNPQPVELETDIRIALGFTGIDDFGIPDTKGYSRAFAEYSEALRLSPDSPLANLAYAKGLMFQGRGVEARAAFRDAAQKYSGGYKISAEKELGIYVYPAVTAPAATSN